MDTSIADIKRTLPHRPPFLFIDKVTDIIPGTSGTGWKMITANEQWLTGNSMAFPNIFFIEIMAQTCAMIFASININDNPSEGYLASFDLKCSGKITPGDIIKAHISILKIWGTFILAKGTIMVDDNELGTGRFTISLVKPATK